MTAWISFECFIGESTILPFPAGLFQAELFDGVGFVDVVETNLCIVISQFFHSYLHPDRGRLTSLLHIVAANAELPRESAHGTPLTVVISLQARRCLPSICRYAILPPMELKM